MSDIIVTLYTQKNTPNISVSCNFVSLQLLAHAHVPDSGVEERLGRNRFVA